MTDTKEISWDDSVLPFHLEGPDMRGRIARLGQTLEHILSRHDYPVAVSALVAELERRFRNDDSVIKFLSVRMDEEAKAAERQKVRYERESKRKAQAGIKERSAEEVMG